MFNHTLIRVLATATVDREECLANLCFALAFFYLMFWRQAKLPVHLMYGMDNTPDVELPEYGDNLKRTLQKVI